MEGGYGRRTCAELEQVQLENLKKAKPGGSHKSGVDVG